MNYKIKSENTLSYIYLHDCLCEKISCQDHRVIIDMAWMEILPNHPCQPYSKAYSSDRGQIIFNDIVSLETILIPWNKDEEKKYVDLYEYDLTNLIILDFHEDLLNEIYTANLYAQIQDCHYVAVEINIQYKSSIVMWNQYDDISWFEKE